MHPEIHGPLLVQSMSSKINKTPGLKPSYCMLQTFLKASFSGRRFSAHQGDLIIGAVWGKSTPTGAPAPLTTGTAYLFSDGTSSTVEALDVSSMKFYPNPTTGEIWVDRNSASSNMEIEVFNVSGQRIDRLYFGPEEKIRIRIQGAPGVYLLQGQRRRTDLLRP